jgi:hypothetical protein
MPLPVVAVFISMTSPAAMDWVAEPAVQDEFPEVIEQVMLLLSVILAAANVAG